jgi:hypothetical protein
MHRAGKAGRVALALIVTVAGFLCALIERRWARTQGPLVARWLRNTFVAACRLEDI